MTQGSTEQSATDVAPIDLSRIMGTPTRGELFNLLSNLYRIVTYQHMALMSLKHPGVDNFEDEMQQSSTEIDGYLKVLEKLIRTPEDRS